MKTLAPVFKSFMVAAGLVALALVVMFEVGGCGGGDAGGQVGGRLKVAASIFPLADVARQIGGDDVAVVTLLPPGISPHGFEPRPRQAEQLAGSRLLLVVGLGMDAWAEESAKASGTSVKTIRFADTVEHGHISRGAGEQHGRDYAGAPHMWLDPLLMKSFVDAVAEAMAELDPAHAEGYRRRSEGYTAELERLDADYRRVLGKTKGKAFVSFHPAFTYLAARYGLEQAAIVQSHSSGFGSEALERVVKFIREHDLKVIFAEPHFAADKLTWLKEQTGVEVGRLDPLGNPAVEGYRTYLEMMRSNLRALSAALTK